MALIILPPETVAEIAATEPLVCTPCMEDSGESVQLAAQQRSAGDRHIGFIVACERGHAHLLALVEVDGRVYMGSIEVERSTAGGSDGG